MGTWKQYRRGSAAISEQFAREAYARGASSYNPDAVRGPTPRPADWGSKVYQAALDRARRMIRFMVDAQARFGRGAPDREVVLISVLDRVRIGRDAAERAVAQAWAEYEAGAQAASLKGATMRRLSFSFAGLAGARSLIGWNRTFGGKTVGWTTTNTWIAGAETRYEIERNNVRGTVYFTVYREGEHVGSRGTLGLAKEFAEQDAARIARTLRNDAGLRGLGGCPSCGLSGETARMYHVIVRDDRPGRADTYMTVTPVTHAEGVTIMRKMLPQRAAYLRTMLVDAAATPRPGSDLPPGGFRGLGALPSTGLGQPPRRSSYYTDHFQRSFNPVDYFFAWTPPTDPRNRFDVGWYTWDETAARAAARQERDVEAKRYAAQGYKVRKWTHGGQRITRGGIGSGHPEVDFIVPVFGFDADKS